MFMSRGSFVLTFRIRQLSMAINILRLDFEVIILRICKGQAFSPQTWLEATC